MTSGFQQFQTLVKINSFFKGQKLFAEGKLGILTFTNHTEAILDTMLNTKIKNILQQMFKFNKLAILMLFLAISVNKGYCQKSNFKPFRYKGFIEIGGGRIFKELNWQLSDFSNISLFPYPNQINDRMSFFQNLTVRSINGFCLRDKCFLGLSLGIEQMRGKIFTIQVNRYFIPIGLDAKYYFSKGPKRPMININSGYSISASNTETTYNSLYVGKIKGGLYFHPSLGLEILTSRYKTRVITLNLGYKIQNLNISFNHTIFPGYHYNLTKLEYLTFMAGYTF